MKWRKICFGSEEGGQGIYTEVKVGQNICMALEVAKNNWLRQGVKGENLNEWGARWGRKFYFAKLSVLSPVTLEHLIPWNIIAQSSFPRGELSRVDMILVDHKLICYFVSNFMLVFYKLIFVKNWNCYLYFIQILSIYSMWSSAIQNSSVVGYLRKIVETLYASLNIAVVVSRLPPQETQYASRSLANFGLIQGASFVKIVLLEYGHVHLFIYCLWLLSH